MFRKMRKMLSETCLVDGILVLFMLILLSYLTFHLFTVVVTNGQNNAIDVVIRTSAAGIFGYFMSRNFGRKPEEVSSQKTDAVYRNTISADSTGQIGFRMRSETGSDDADGQFTDPTAAMQTGKIIETPSVVPSSKGCDRMQIIVISAVGLCSLIILLFARQFYTDSTEFTAIISQLRDFFSASVGFLISYRKGTSE